MVGVDRAVLVLKPKAPFLAWARSVDEEATEISMEALSLDSTAYLVPDFESDAERAHLIENFFVELFEEQLDSWHADQEKWPVERGLEMFHEWFEPQFHSVVLDVMEARVLHDDEGFEDDLEDTDWPNSIL